MTPENISEQAKSLGIPLSQIENEGLVRIDFLLSPQYKVKIPTGNEWGTNSLWLPGGQLRNGNIEGIIETIGMKKDIDYIIKNILK